MWNFAFFDITRTKLLSEWITEVTKDKIGVFVGTHLCGNLSESFIEVFNNVNQLKCGILSPCCLPKRDKTIRTKAKKMKLNGYQLWTLYLYFLLKSDHKNIQREEEMISTKNNFIMALR